MASEPTNADLKKEYDQHVKEDREFQREDREFQKNQKKVNEESKRSRDAIHERLKNIPTKDETALIVEEVISKLLLKKGKLTISIVLGAGALAAAVVAILGGFKAILALFFFSK